MTTLRQYVVFIFHRSPPYLIVWPKKYIPSDAHNEYEQPSASGRFLHNSLGGPLSSPTDS